MGSRGYRELLEQRDVLLVNPLEVELVLEFIWAIMRPSAAAIAIGIRTASPFLIKSSISISPPIGPVVLLYSHSLYLVARCDRSRVSPSIREQRDCLKPPSHHSECTCAQAIARNIP